MTRSKGTGRTGRPLKLHTVIDRDAAGAPITAGDKVIALVGSVWCPWEDAAATVGVDARTIREWRRTGATARARIATWNPVRDAAKPITGNEYALADFVNRLEQAEAKVHAAHLGVITNASKGGLTEVRVVETVVDGKVVSKVTTTITKPPVWQASAWMLQSRRSDLYRRRFEFTGPNGEALGSRAERAETIGGWLEGYLEGQADQEKVGTKESANGSC